MVNKKLDNQIKAYFRKRGVVISNKDMPEVRNSLAHLGKAIYLYIKQKSNQ